VPASVGSKTGSYAARKRLKTLENDNDVSNYYRMLILQSKQESLQREADRKEREEERKEREEERKERREAKEREEKGKRSPGKQ
jgi:hypothetical protein